MTSLQEAHFGSFCCAICLPAIWLIANGMSIFALRGALRAALLGDNCAFSLIKVSVEAFAGSIVFGT
ncbi:hypothetical protein [Gardnerella sp. DNF01205]|uniref:hypothetical protein n=1 Tax=Gardnerella sp. DNF01205 TaxID=2749069 RepID=UPI003BA97772